jgi:hypothetical protein
MSKSVLNLGAERDVQEFGGTVDRDGSAAEMTTTARELFDTLRAQRLEPGSPDSSPGVGSRPSQGSVIAARREGRRPSCSRPTSASRIASPIAWLLPAS